MYNLLHRELRYMKLTGNRRHQPAIWFLAAVIIVSLMLSAAGQTTAPASGKLPRFASLKASPVNLRTGPGRQYPKSWVFNRAGLPVEVMQTHGAWRRVRDAEGVTGWVSKYLVSQRRTALVKPWDVKKSSTQVYVDLKLSPQSTAKNVARLEAGSLLNVKSCDGQWCDVSINEFSGYIEQIALWGVYPSERIS